MIGLLKEVKEIVTKNGRRMAFAVLEDLRGSIELVVFADVFEKSRALLTVDRVVAAVGRVDRSRGDPKLKVERLLRPEGPGPPPAPGGARALRLQPRRRAGVPAPARPHGRQARGLCRISSTSGGTGQAGKS